MKKSFPAYAYLSPRHKSSGIDDGTILFFLIPIVVLEVITFLIGVLGVGMIFPVPVFILPVFILIIALLIIHNKLIQSTRKIVIGNTFLMEGNSIVFYQNITTLDINRKIGELKITTPSKKIIVNKKYFPTESTKPHKIKISQTKKFNNISRKIYDKVKDSNDAVKIVLVKS